MRQDDSRFGLRMLRRCWYHSFTKSKGGGEGSLLIGVGNDEVSFRLVKFEVAVCDTSQQIFICWGKLGLEVTIRDTMFLDHLDQS